MSKTNDASGFDPDDLTALLAKLEASLPLIDPAQEKADAEALNRLLTDSQREADAALAAVGVGFDAEELDRIMAEISGGDSLQKIMDDTPDLETLLASLGSDTPDLGKLLAELEASDTPAVG